MSCSGDTIYAYDAAGSLNQEVCLTSGYTLTTLSSEHAISGVLGTIGDDLDTTWVMVCAILVFWMQAGFAMLEAGSVRKRNVKNILFKNIMDASIGAICFWLLGYSFAYGNGDQSWGNSKDNEFIGFGNWALQNLDDNATSNYVSWFFQWAFAGAAATIVSGAVAERCKLEGYFCYTIALTTFIYPVVVHWVWSSSGYLSAFATDSEDGTRPHFGKNGMIDFAGSGVVHMTGGFAALIGAITIGARTDFKTTGQKPKGHSTLLQSLGVAILWMGWYGFNCGSTLAAKSNAINLAAKVAVTTTIAAASGAITCMLISRAMAAATGSNNQFDMGLTLNGVLAGLVSITAPCPVVEPWGAMMIGIIGGMVYVGASKALVMCGIDDPLDAFPVHGACGAWGCLSVGIFATKNNIMYAYGKENDAMTSTHQFWVQLAGVVAIAAWVSATSAMVFVPLKLAGLLRVDPETEEKGLDESEHGGMDDAVELKQTA
jgi:Amt family ammonium transporter